MGVEYEHWFFASDPHWIGNIATARNVSNVLQNWGLIVDSAPELFSLDGGKAKKLKVPLDQLAMAPRNLIIQFPMCTTEIVEEIMGPSYYAEEEIGPRYFQAIVIIMGTDFRVYNGGETTFTQILHPPTRDGKLTSAYKPDFRFSYWSDVFPADEKATPPDANLIVEAENWKVPKQFHGIWRAGLLLDCGKDLPSFMGKSNNIPSKRFTRDVEKAFGTKILQIGQWY
jgi:hypothetical protein